jgi:dolichyl-phosphate-mannose--protein O-mannosyl transferase
MAYCQQSTNLVLSFYFRLIITLLCCTSIISHDHITEAEIQQSIDESVITYGSAIRLENFITKFQLYSNKYTWGTGSQLQIITGIRQKDDSSAIWIIKEANNEEMKITGTPVMCGDIIRLEHSSTGKNLHSHNYRSWITDSQEACGYGDNGNGDDNDNFKLICYGTEEKKLFGKTNFFLFHIRTEKYLYINIKTSLFDERNCRNCPILNQREVSLTEAKDKQGLWKISGGLIFKEKEDDD